LSSWLLPSATGTAVEEATGCGRLLDASAYSFFSASVNAP
jgi:hypothetical protein